MILNIQCFRTVYYNNCSLFYLLLIIIYNDARYPHKKKLFFELATCFISDHLIWWQPKIETIKKKKKNKAHG